jgi:hypothetical protein
MARYLTKYVTQSPASHTASFIAYVLARYHRPVSHVEDQLYIKRKTLPFFSRLLLASALAFKNKEDERRQTRSKTMLYSILQHVEDNQGIISLNEDGFDQYFHSNDRNLAFFLQALLLIEPNHPYVFKIIKTLMKKRTYQGHLQNTQVAGFTLLALRDYVEHLEKETPNYQVSLEGQYKSKTSSPKISRLLDQKWSGRSLEPFSFYAPASSLNKLESLKIQKKGQGALYYRYELTYRPVHRQEEPINQGLIVYKQYRKLGDTHFTHSVQVGDLVEVHLDIITRSEQHYIVIDDPLPGGLEVVDSNLKTMQKLGVDQARGSSFFDHIEIQNDRVILFDNHMSEGVYRFKYITRATTTGRFIRMPAQAKDMYNPEIYGQSTGGLFWIQPKDGLLK